MKQSPKYTEARQRLIELTGQSDLWLAELVYHKGTQWLDNRYKGVKSSIKLFERSRAFWQWWNNQMNLQITEFLEMIDLPQYMYHTGSMRLTAETENYIFMQWMHFISNYREVYPNQTVWQLAEKEMYAAVDAELKSRSNV